MLHHAQRSAPLFFGQTSAPFSAEDVAPNSDGDHNYKGQILIAKHGPWNRTVKEGAEVAIAYRDGDTGIARTEPFLTGFIVDNVYVGRPVDVATMRDGALLVSDDGNGAIWRVSRDD